MASIPEVYAIAVQHQQAGQLGAAIQVCEQILAVHPEHCDALNLLGIAYAQVGQHELAARYMGRAVALQETNASFHSNLGSILKDMGKLEEAAACCRRALALQPDHASAHYNLGNVWQARGKLAEAADCFRRAVEFRPGYIAALNNLGNAYLEQGKFDEAADCFHRAIELQPAYAEAHCNLGKALNGRGRLSEAIEYYRRAVELNPSLIDAGYNLGTALQRQGKLDEAIAAYRRVLELSPEYTDALSNLGAALYRQGKQQEASACYLRVIELKPDQAAAHYNFGTVLQAEGKFHEAISSFQRALELQPDYAEAANNLGKALTDQGKPDEALIYYRRALDLKPEQAVTQSNLAYAFQQLRRLDEAAAGYERALQLEANCADARFGRSTLRLLQGELEQGWTEYEWRWHANKLPRRDFMQSRWRGEHLGEQSVLLHAEQGFGDTIQFVRYAALIKKGNPKATVIVECQRPLMRLLRGCPGIDQLIPHGDKLPSFDVQAPLLSVPGILGTTVNTIPAEIPYLVANAALVDQWRERLKLVTGLRIGLNWRGRSTTWQRDIPLEQLERLTELRGLSFISLQRGATGEELSAAAGSGGTVIDLGEELDRDHGAFMDTAAVMKNLDLVISSDTAIPHLAGALGVPVWVALPFVPDWRWLLDRADSPWYPTMRLFRQQSVGEWSKVIDEIVAELARLGS